MFQLYSHGMFCAIAALLVVGINGYSKVGSASWPLDEHWLTLYQELGGTKLRKIGNVSTVHSECLAALSYGIGATVVNQAANGTCSFAGSCVFEGCVAGAAHNLPEYSVAALEPSDVQVAIRFANAHNIRVSIKSTGADYSVANTQSDSILIWMSNFVKYSEEGVKPSFVDSCGSDKGPVIKVGGGETWGAVFKAMAADGRYLLSSGAAVTVGATGGWLQGGGLGPMDRELGLGIDNVVQFEVVLADGSLKTVDACSEPDLFWALRGGGGGNWGVVLSATYKVHPIKKMVRAKIMWAGAAIIGQMTQGAPVGTPIPLKNSFDNNKEFYIPKTEMFGNVSHESISKWHDLMLGTLNPVTMDPRLDGYYGINCQWPDATCADLYFRGSMEEFEEAFLAPVREALGMPDEGVQGNAAVGGEFVYHAGEYDSFYAYAAESCVNAADDSPDAYICKNLMYPSSNGYNTDAGPEVSTYGPKGAVVWLVPGRLFMEDKDKMKELVKDPFFFYAMGHIIGGNVMVPGGEDTAISPAIRKSAMHFILTPEMDPFSDTMSSFRTLIHKYFPPPESGPCFNHDALNEEVLKLIGEPYGLDWQQLYWGSNLERLQQVKATYDPTGVFTCRDCVTAKGEAGGMTCGDVKAAYKASGCCGNPMKTFKLDAGRRMSVDSSKDDLVELQNLIERELKEALESGGPSKAARLADEISKVMQSYTA